MFLASTEAIIYTVKEDLLVEIPASLPLLTTHRS
jgi:hypothetical protein